MYIKLSGKLRKKLLERKFFISQNFLLKETKILHVTWNVEKGKAALWVSPV